MKKWAIIIIILFCFFLSCHSSKNVVATANKSADVVRIANDSLEYEVIIIDPGFNSWLASNAKPRGFYAESYLENRNLMLITEWNNRVSQPQRYDPNLYEIRIDYNPNIHYGYEVNYLIYNYMIYFQIVYKQQFNGFVPRP
jgi:hypothetical protein